MALVDVDTDVQQTNLTLTSVVFEFLIFGKDNTFIIDLTLTSVVFELGVLSLWTRHSFLFNFNKCCI